MTIEIDVSDQSAVAVARRSAVDLAAQSGWTEEDRGRVALVTTELASNILNHAGRGYVLAGVSNESLDLLALDLGPGISDLAASMEDGHSTAGTRGNGLGAIKRLSQDFEAISWPGRGAIVMARLTVNGILPSRSLAALVLAKHGETVCGDAWSVHEGARGQTLLVADGLGHGTEAAIAAHEAVATFHRHPDDSPANILRAIHAEVRHTRGAAVAVAQVDGPSRVVHYAGLGNCVGALVSSDGTSKRLVSHNGTAGHTARKIQAFDYPLSDAILVLHSDGVATTWDIASYPGLWHAHPLLIAATLYRDFSRRRDDACIVVSRMTR